MLQELTTLQKIYESILAYLVGYSFQLFGAAVIILAGLVVAKWASSAVLRLQEGRNVDVTLRHFIASTVRLLVLVMFVVIALAKLGISITPLIAAIGGLAVGASFALQGPVSNYGAGLIIILTRMFKVGDTITVQGCSGLVAEITLATTRLQAADGEDIVIPNKHIVGEIHRNSYAFHIVEGTLGIGAASDASAAAEIIRLILEADPGVQAIPKVQVGIDSFSEAALVMGFRYWVPTPQLFEIKHRVNGQILVGLRRGGLEVLPPRQVILTQSPR